MIKEKVTFLLQKALYLSENALILLHASSRIGHMPITHSTHVLKKKLSSGEEFVHFDTKC